MIFPVLPCQLGKFGKWASLYAAGAGQSDSKLMHGLSRASAFVNTAKRFKPGAELVLRHWLEALTSLLY